MSGFELWLPIAQRLPVSIARLSQFSALTENKRQIDDLSQRWGGRAAKPREPVTIVGPDGRTPIMILGAGEAEAAEIEDIALAMHEEAEARMQQVGTAIDFAEWRARHGLVPREEFDTAFRQALLDRIEKHRKSPVSDPPLDIWKSMAKGQSQVSVGDQGWKEQGATD